MPELKDLEGRASWPAAELDWDKYAYTDKTKEEKRLAELAKLKMEEANGIASSHKSKQGPKPTQAWSRQIEAKEKREVNREKKARKRAYLKEEARKEAESAEASKNEGTSLSDEDDAEDLANEERAAKKLKRGRMDQAEFDMNFAEL